MNFAIAASASTPPAATPAAALEHRKLTDAAQQFEGMLLQEMLKPMKDKQDGDDTAEDKGTGEGDTLSSYGVETMATAISKAGGLGIAKQIVTQVEHEKLYHSQGAAHPTPQQFQNKTATVLKSAPIKPIN